MKVLDLQCTAGHTFEGWFASEDDFVAQSARAMVQCPLCGDAAVHKKPSAPRLNLSTRRQDNRGATLELPGQPQDQAAQAAATTLAGASTANSAVASAGAHAPADASLTAAWLELSRRIVANTQDVGEHFAEEARKMHYGETEERAIRGKTTMDEARALVEEGIDVLPMVLPQSLKKPLQ